MKLQRKIEQVANAILVELSQRSENPEISFTTEFSIGFSKITLRFSED